ncbi:MAG: hypothetical protein OXK80_05850 [Bdellovibrionales bacterium]|nr:hypothetical protein [Bdellovibrionales bacterium]
MISLRSSKLYGTNTPAPVSCDSTTYGAGCSGCSVSGTTCTGNTSGCASSSDDGQTCGQSAYSPADPGNGPGKDNFIGFGTDNCTTANLASRQIKDAGTTNETRCQLGVTTYRLGVGGHLSGDTFIGINVTNDGVVTEQGEDVSGNVFSTSHANGVCA